MILADVPGVDPAAIGVPVSLVAVEGDPLVPLADAVALLEALGDRARLRVLRSRYGHDAFLKDTDRIDALLASELALVDAASPSPSPISGASA